MTAVRGFIRSVYLKAILATVVIASGCKSMTNDQLKFAALEKEREERETAVGAADAEEKIAALNEEQRKLARKAKEIELRLARDALRTEASEFLSSGDNKAAIGKVSEIFAFSKEGEYIDGDDEPVTPPELTNAEKARLTVIAASAYFNEGKVDGAIKLFDKATELDPSLRDARRNLGKLLFSEGRYKEALAAFEKELADGYRDADMLFLIAKARYELGHQTKDDTQKEAARIALQEVIIERPADKEVRYWRAMLAYETRRYGEAARLLEDLRADFPLDVQYLHRLADCYRQLEKPKKAIDYFELVAQVDAPRRKTSAEPSPISTPKSALRHRRPSGWRAPTEMTRAQRQRTTVCLPGSSIPMLDSSTKPSRGLGRSARTIQGLPTRREP